MYHYPPLRTGLHVSMCQHKVATVFRGAVRSSGRLSAGMPPSEGVARWTCSVAVVEAAEAMLVPRKKVEIDDIPFAWLEE